MSRSTASAWAERTPATIRAGVRVSATACPSRRNSGFQASSARRPTGASAATRSASAAAVPDRRGGLARYQAGPRQQRGQGVHAGVELAEVGLGTAGLLRGAHAQEVHVAEPRRLGQRGGEPEPARPQAAAEQRRRGRVRGTAPGPGSGPGSWPGRCPRPAPRSPARPGRPRAPRRGTRCRSRSGGACHPASSRSGGGGAARYPVRAAVIVPAGRATPRFAADPAGQTAASRQRVWKRRVTRA